MSSRRSRMWVWLLWLFCFYATWLILVAVGHHGQTLRDHWQIAVAMAAGSYVAGATPMGGGSVGFPVLVLLLNQTPVLGRDFSFAVQSIGMTSAAIFILSRRQAVAWSMLGPAMAGSLIGTILGLLFVAPYVSGLLTKLLFAGLWASFGILHLCRTRRFAEVEGATDPWPRFDRRAGFAIGLLGGATVAAITGVGIDMMIYTTLVLVRRTDLKIAIPTSVILMAFTSVVGILFKGFTSGVQPGVYEHWLAAAPIVALGAPLGVFVVAMVGRTYTLYFVSVLCVGQFLWTMHAEWDRLGVQGCLFTLAAVVVFNLMLEWLYRLRGRHTHAPEVFAPPPTPSCSMLTLVVPSGRQECEGESEA